MRVDWLKYDRENHVIAWFLLAAMSEKGIKDFGEFDSSNLDVKFTVNGIDIPFIDAFERLNDHIEDKEGEMFLKARLQNNREICDEIEHLKESVSALNELLNNTDIDKVRR